MTFFSDDIKTKLLSQSGIEKSFYTQWVFYMIHEVDTFSVLIFSIKMLKEKHLHKYSF